MLPERIPLAIMADLSEASYEHSCSLLQSKTQREWYFNVYPTLKVSLWDADTAIQIMAKYKNCDIHIVQSYRKDEWSVTETNLKEDKQYEIYSEGA